MQWRQHHVRCVNILIDQLTTSQKTVERRPLSLFFCAENIIINFCWETDPLFSAMYQTCFFLTEKQKSFWSKSPQQLCPKHKVRIRVGCWEAKIIILFYRYKEIIMIISYRLLKSYEKFSPPSEIQNFQALDSLRFY